MSSPRQHTTEETELKFPATEAGRREWIKAALAVHGWTLGRIARELGCARSTPRNALWRSAPSMEREIARRIGTTPEAIWPERYDARAARARRKAGGAR